MTDALPEAEDVSPEQHRGRMAIAVLALIGIFISAYLLLHKLGYIGTLTCGIGDCNTVQLSPYAVFLGVPVPALGLLGYATIMVLALVGVNRDHKGIAAALLLLGLGAFGFSMYLTMLEAFVIHAWCQWCVGSAIVATLIFLFSLAEIPRLRRG